MILHSNVCVAKVVESNIIVAFVDMGQWDDRVQPEHSFLYYQRMLDGYVRALNGTVLKGQRLSQQLTCVVTLSTRSTSVS